MKTATKELFIATAAFLQRRYGQRSIVAEFVKQMNDSLSDLEASFQKLPQLARTAADGSVVDGASTDESQPLALQG